MIELASWNHVDLYKVQRVTNTDYQVLERPADGRDPVLSLSSLLVAIVAQWSADAAGLIRPKLLFVSDLDEMLELYKEAALYVQVFYCNRESLEIRLHAAGRLLEPAMISDLLIMLKQDRMKADFPYELRVSLAHQDQVIDLKPTIKKNPFNV